MKKLSAGLLLTGLVAAAAPAHGQSGTIGVNTQWSLYLAGGNAYSSAPVGGQPGIEPPAIALTAGTNRTLTVTATGSSAFCGPGVCVASTPDGPAIGGTNLAASGLISGIVAPTSGFLAGVFLGPTLPGSTPPSLDFNALTTSFASLAPALGQLFFIGDGLTAGGVQQQFLVPDAASRLFFGIADGGSFVGNPGFYADNVGTYTTTYAVSATSTVPEPSTWALLATGLATIAGISARRRRRGALPA